MNVHNQGIVTSLIAGINRFAVVRLTLVRCSEVISE
jgi:hypothetical protein